MENVYQFVLTFYKIFVSKNSNTLKKFYFNTFETQLKIDDGECDDTDNSCLFDELYDELTERIKKTIQNIGGILYCDIDGGFLITRDEASGDCLINGEVLEKDINEATCYFYDLFSR